MKKIKQLFLSLISASFILSLLVFSTQVKAVNETVTNEIALTSGYMCLCPHLDQPSTSNPIQMTAVPSTEYKRYSQDILHKIAAAVILRGDFQQESNQSIDEGTLQSVIWAIVCPAETCPSKNQVSSSLGHLSGRPLAQEYYNYVNNHYSNVANDYVMTIWVSSNPKYQDVLEIKLVEKHGVPSVEKKVLDSNDSRNDSESWQDSADYDIGDQVPFQITATLSELPNFKAYYLEFVDQMDHFDLNTNSIKVEMIKDGVKKDVTSAFTKEVSTSGTVTNLNIKCENILTLGASDYTQFVVTYNARLNETANIGVAGNPNSVHLVYTRTTGTADKGISPDDLVRVFTYQIVIHKADGNGDPLQGASFKLSKILANGKSQVINGIQDQTGTQFTWTGLDDGTYLLEETITPVGYNTIQPIEFTIDAIHNTNSQDPHLTYLYSNYAGFDGFMTYEDYNQLEFATGHPIIQLPGYILPWPQEEISATIVNYTGAVLPDTGGLGTNLIYTIGSIMLLTSGILLVSKKRMK